MSLKSTYLRATVETKEQFEACIGLTDIVYIDSAFFKAGAYAGLIKKAHEVGTLIGLRLPRIWREKAEKYFDEHLYELKEADFDAYLFCNAESLLYFREQGLLSDTEFATDSSMYIFNAESALELRELVPEDIRANFVSMTLPLELNYRELRSYSSLPGTELTVYGRAPMMVTAQCINKTVTGCDSKERTLFLKDRKAAKMPVKNCCDFCYNLIYNSVPTYICDLTDTIREISPSALRYDFTTESAAEVRNILLGVPLRAGSFTRGHLKRGV